MINEIKNAPTDSIAQSILDLLRYKKPFEDYIDYFFQKFKVEELLETLNVTNKRRRNKPVDILKYLIKVTVTGRSIYQDYHGGFNSNKFSLKSVYRFLSNDSINWISLTTMLSYAVFESFYNSSLGIPAFFIFDDSAFERPYANYCEGISFQHDHNAHRSYRGYRLCLLSLYWNGYLFPISGVLISTVDEEKMIFYEPKKNPTKAEAIRHFLLKLKANQVMQYQIRIAQSVGFDSRYLLFDSWYAHPRIIDRIKPLGLEVIGMLKTYGTTRFRYNGKFYKLKELYEYLNPKPLPFQVEVDVVIREKNKEILSFPATLTFNYNRYKDREYFCLLSSSTGFPLGQVNSYFKYRWSIEQAFKDLKNSNLNLISGNQSLSLTAISGYIGVVLIRYLVILSERNFKNMNDKRSIQDQYYQTAREITSIEYGKIYYDGIRSGLKKISKEFNIDLEELEKSFSEGSSESEAFAAEAEFLQSAITNQKD